MANICPECETANPPDSKFCKECASPLAAAGKAIHTRTYEFVKKELNTGSIFADRYQVIEELGMGGMGLVYKVLDKETTEKIALKLIKPEIASDKTTVERFRNELTTARKIVQKNVCRMYDLGRDGDDYYITMEYISGQDLKGLMRQTGQLTVGKAVSIAKQICEGLAEAHSLGIVHRDLKPNNIMIDDNGNARIMDFGIARPVKGKSLTGSGVMVGTPMYMSPEQVEGKDIDPRSDIYSLGIILFEMLTGQVPFDSDTPLSVALKHKSETPQDPGELNPRIPDDLSRIILTCLEKDRNRRFQSAREVARELENVAAGSTPISGLSRTSTNLKPKKPRSLFLIAGAAVLTLAAASLLFFLLKGSGQNLDPKRVAVASFTNRTGQSSFDQLGSIAADLTMQGLAETGIVEVIPSSTIETVLKSYQSGDINDFLAEETGSGIIISGHYYLEDKSICFQSQITDASKGKLLRAMDAVCAPEDKPLEAAEALRLKIMAVLSNHFEPLITGWAAVDGEPQNYEAYLEFLEGGKLFISRQHREAVKHFERAIELDPGFTSPLFMGAVNFLNLGEQEKFEALALKIQERREFLGPNDRIHLDWLLAVVRGDNNGLYQASKKLVARNPGSTWEYQLASDALKINRPREAIEALAHLDPARGLFKDWYPYWGHLTAAHHLLGDHKQELREAQKARDQYPDHPDVLWYEIRALAPMGRVEDVNRVVEYVLNIPSQTGYSDGSIMRIAAAEFRRHGYREAALELASRAVSWYEAQRDRDNRYMIGRAMILAERWEEARSVFEALQKHFPDNVNIIGYLGTVEARLGHTTKARELSESLRSLDDDHLYGSNTYWRSCIAALLGEKEEAMNLLRASLRQGVSFLRLHSDMDLEPLYDYPPFQELIRPKE